MGLFTWIEAKMQNLHWYDISLTKIATAAFILMIAKFWPGILGLDWYWYLVIGIVAATRPVMAMFTE